MQCPLYFSCRFNLIRSKPAEFGIRGSRVQILLNFAGTLTTGLCSARCRPRGRETNFMNGIRVKISCRSRDVNSFNFCGTASSCNLFIFDCAGILPRRRAPSQVLQSRKPSILLNSRISANILLGVLLYLSPRESLLICCTEHLYISRWHTVHV